MLEILSVILACVILVTVIGLVTYVVRSIEHSEEIEMDINSISDEDVDIK